jgi:hypothetical protein
MTKEVKMSYIYWILDDEEMPDEPDENRYLGRLYLKQANALKCVWNLCKQKGVDFDGDTDFLLRSNDVRLLLNCCHQCLEKVLLKSRKELYTDFMILLESAIEKGGGIAHYAD